MKIAVIDNYDSFTYNLVYMIRDIKEVKRLEVLRNDQFDLEDIKLYDKILLSPGPGIPSEAGLMPEIIKQYCNSKSIFGVCLGHQGLGEFFGCSLENMDAVKHGIQETVTLDNEDFLFKGIPDQIKVGKYHSWRIKQDGLGNGIEVISRDIKGNVMGIRHKSLDVRGVQFHPESVMTEYGKTMIDNWIKQ